MKVTHHSANTHKSEVYTSATLCNFNTKSFAMSISKWTSSAHLGTHAPPAIVFLHLLQCQMPTHLRFNVFYKIHNHQCGVLYIEYYCIHLPCHRNSKHTFHAAKFLSFWPFSWGKRHIWYHTCLPLPPSSYAWPDKNDCDTKKNTRH